MNMFEKFFKNKTKESGPSLDERISSLCREIEGLKQDIASLQWNIGNDNAVRGPGGDADILQQRQDQLTNKQQELDNLLDI